MLPSMPHAVLVEAALKALLKPFSLVSDCATAYNAAARTMASSLPNPYAASTSPARIMLNVNALHSRIRGACFRSGALSRSCSMQTLYRLGRTIPHVLVTAPWAREQTGGIPVVMPARQPGAFTCGFWTKPGIPAPFLVGTLAGVSPRSPVLDEGTIYLIDFWTKASIIRFSFGQNACCGNHFLYRHG